MTDRPPFHQLLPVALACGLMMAGMASCRKAGVVEPLKPEAALAPVLLANGLESSGSTLVADQSRSPIHWQPWSRETLEAAKQANRLAFVVIATPRQADSTKVLKALGDDAALVEEIHANFVPVLVDSDACREMQLLAAELCREAKRPLTLPLFVWLTPQGDPALAVPARSPNARLRDVFGQAAGQMEQQWRDSQDYVLSDSAGRNKVRGEHLAQAAACPPASTQPGIDAGRAIRQLTEGYDPRLHSFDRSGSLFPSGVLDLLADAAVMPDMPAELAARSRETAAAMVKDLSTSAMMDPLEGRLFTSHTGTNWGLPGFTSDCGSEARLIVSFAAASRLKDDPLVRSWIPMVLACEERHHGVAGGLFAAGRPGLRPPATWLWSIEEIEAVLSVDEMKVWKVVSDLRGLGNISPESDPNREYFRRNVLACRTAPEAAAESLGMPPAEARAAYESGRRKLLALRETRALPGAEDPRPQAVASFRMASAYAAAYALTGEIPFKNKAVATLKAARDAFGEGDRLRMFPGSESDAGSGRAFLYGVAMQAALDVADITLDENWQAWAAELAGTAAGSFIRGTTLLEVEPSRMLIPIPAGDRRMVSDDSSAGLLAQAEARLSKAGRSMPEAFGRAVASLPLEVADKPLLHTDALLATLVRTRGPLVIVSPDAPDAMKLMVGRLPLRVIARRQARKDDLVPSNQAAVIFSDGTRKYATVDTIGPTLFAGDPAP